MTLRSHLSLFLKTVAIMACCTQAALAEPWQARHQRACTPELMGASARKVSSAPDEDAVKLLKTLKDYIVIIGAKYGVDPRVIAGSILAEHSLNSGVKDMVEGLLVKTGLAPKGEILGKQRSFGFGQLKYDSASAAEDVASVVENRPRRTGREIELAMLTPEGAIDYIGALLKLTQDTYAKGGFNISGDVGVLGTLFNIGKVNERLVRTRQENRAPDPNYFGCWIEDHLDVIDQVLQGATAEVKVMPKTGTIADEHPESGFLRIPRALKLDQGPSGCYDDPLFARGSIPVESGAVLESVGTAVDCRSTPWMMVRTQSGRLGWLPRSSFASAAPVAAPQGCTQVQDSQCSAKVMSQFGAYLQGEASGGELRFSLARKPEEQKSLRALPGAPIRAKYLDALRRRYSEASSGQEFFESVKQKAKAFDGVREILRTDLDRLDGLIAKIQAKQIPPPALPAVAGAKAMIDSCKSYVRDASNYNHDHNLVNRQRCYANPDRIFQTLNLIQQKLEDPNADWSDVIVLGSNDVISSQDYRFTIGYVDPVGLFERDLKELESCLNSASELPRASQKLRDRLSEIWAIVEAMFDGDSVRGNVPVHSIRNLQGLLGYYDFLPPLCETMTKLRETSRALQAGRSDVNCSAMVRIPDSTNADLRGTYVPIGDALEILATAEDQDKALESTMMRLKDKETHTFGKKQEMITMRDLAKGLASIPCVNSVIVPLPTLATSEKLVYQPMGGTSDRDQNQVVVDLRKFSCSKRK